VKQVNAFINFIIFVEEFLLWNPGRINTLIEKIFVVIFRGLEGGETVSQFVFYLNPFVAFFFLSISVGVIVGYVKSIFSENARANMLIWLERNSYIRVILAVILGIVFLLQLMKVFDNPYLTLRLIYQNKSLWGIIFAYMIVKRLISEKAWS
jgi:hypothetical protein